MIKSVLKKIDSPKIVDSVFLHTEGKSSGNRGIYTEDGSTVSVDKIMEEFGIGREAAEKVHRRLV